MKNFYLFLLFVFVFVFVFCSSLTNSQCVSPDFDSGWISMSSVTPTQPIPANPTYLEINHNLGTTDLEVRVQAKANSVEGFVFNAMGFPQSDDDLDDYAGVVFAYNSNSVRLWTPSRNITGLNTDGTGDGKGLMVRTGGNGWSDVNNQSFNAQVRVVIWKENFNKANFDSDWFPLSENSPTQDTFAVYNHSLGAVPSKLKTLIRVESGPNQGFIFIASTQAQKDARALQGFGGAVVAYDDQQVKLWTPQYGSLGKVIFIGDGWGSENYAQFSGAAVGRILAWKSSRYVPDYSTTFSMSTASAITSYSSHTLPFFVNDIVVQFKSSSGLIFEAMGSSQGTDKKRGKEFLPYGGLTFGYKSNGSEVRVWAPYSAKTTVGNIVSLGIGWTNTPIIENSAIVTIKAWICPRIYSQCSIDQFLNSTFDCESCNCGIGSYQQSCDFNGKCLCKPGFSDIKCSICDSDKFLNSGSCQACNCGSGSLSSGCDSNGNCSCLPYFSDNKCTFCVDGKFGSDCSVDCNCGIIGSITNKCNSEGKCECKTGFSLPKCSTCLDSYYGINCESCNCGIGSLNSNCSNDYGICSCKPHFIGDKCDSCQDGYFLFNGDCIACNCGIGSSNNTCVDGICNCVGNFEGQKCDSCKPLFYGSNCENSCVDCGNGKCDDGLNKSGKCICDPGWVVNANGKCEKCGFDSYGDSCTKCNCGAGSVSANCSSSGVCSCKPLVIGDKCDTCLDGFYLSGSVCSACNCGIGSSNNTCIDGICNCVGNFEGQKCDSCKPLFYGSNCENSCIDCGNGKCQDGLNSNGKCICNDGWDLDSNGKCTICDFNRFGPTCSKCPDCGNGFCQDGINGDGTCVCSVGWKGGQTPCSVCDSHFTLVNNQCQRCDVTCSECSGTSNNECTKCYSGSFFESGKCKNACSIGKYSDINGICQNCNSKCNSCVNFDTCIDCKDGYFFYQGSCLSQCPSNTFSDASICLDCNSDCLTCDGKSNSNCIKCRNGLFKQNDYCVSNCNSGSFKNFTTSQCQKCQDLCVDCNNYDTCNTCQTGILNFNGKCIESCPDGYYPSSGTCKPCSVTCKTCSGSEYFQCTSCYSNGALPYLNINTCVSSCPIGQYLLNGVCHECKCNGFSILCNSQGICLNCQGNRDGKNCESCSLGYFMTDSGVCQKCSCNGRSDKCKNSTGECLECGENTSGFNCELCIDGLQKNQNGQCVSQSDSQKNKTMSIIIGVLVPSIIICVSLTAVYIFITRRKRRNLISPEMSDRTSQFFEIYPRKSSSIMPDAGSTIVNTVYGTEISLPGFLKMKMSEIKMSEEIGAGGSGNVFSGEILNVDIISLFPKDCQKAAIKLVRDIPTLTDAENIDNFHQEVSVNHALSFHPNICKLIAYTESPNAIVSPLYQGDLSQLIYNKTLHYTILDVFDMIYHISSALEAIHGLGVSHRDIKPKNILMEARQGIETRAPGKLSNFPFNLRICDFGICHVKSSSLVIGFQRMRNQFGMSIRYASPESLSFHNLSIVDQFEDPNDYQKSDIYSLGISIWEICHRLIPWQNMENSEIQQRVTQGQRPSITLEKFDIASHILCELMESCWNQDGKKRPSSNECCNEIFQFARDNSDLSVFKNVIF